MSLSRDEYKEVFGCYPEESNSEIEKEQEDKVKKLQRDFDNLAEKLRRSQDKKQ